MGQVVQYIKSYLSSSQTPGAAGNMFWVLVYILLVFVGLSVAVIAMNWLERKILAHMQVRLGPMRVGPHGLMQPIADALKLLLKEDIMPAEADGLIFWVAPFVVVLAAFTVFVVVPVWAHACHHRHEHWNPLHARCFFAERAGHRDGGMGFELALSADRRAALQRADGVVRSCHGTGRGFGHSDDQPQRRGNRNAQHDWHRAGAAGAGRVVHLQILSRSD